MKIIGLINKIYNDELQDNTLIKLTYDNWNTIEYWRYHNGSLYYNDSEFIDKNKMDLFSYLADENIMVEIIRSNNIGDNYKFCGLDWTIIDKFDGKIKLMSKDVVRIMAYSDDNSNDWVESNVRKFLNEDFINKLDKSKLIKMRTNYDEDKFSEDYIRIPTLREMEKLPINLRDCDNVYWTMTSSYGVSEDCSNASVFAVLSYGYLYSNHVDHTPGVRPVILVEEN